MKVTIINQYSHQIQIEITKFRMSNWQYKEFQITLVDEPNIEILYQLKNVGFKSPNWTSSKLIWEINPDNISHFSSEL